jgi:integrase
MNEIETDQIISIYKRLLEMLPTKGYVRIELYLAILSAWAKRNGVEHLTKDLNYYTLHDEIVKAKGTREAYTDDDMSNLFAACRKNAELQKLLILMTYSGLRIGACYPVHYDDFSKVDGHNVFTYEVTSKGTTYNAIMAPRAFEALQRFRAPGQTLVVQHDNGYSAPFANRYRDMFNTALRRDNLYKLRQGKSIFHSIRKYYSQKLLGSELDPLSFDYKILMGHIPRNTMATKFYITTEGKKVPLDLLKRIAGAYEKTSLMKMEIGLF